MALPPHTRCGNHKDTGHPYTEKVISCEQGDLGEALLEVERELDGRRSENRTKASTYQQM